MIDAPTVAVILPVRDRCDTVRESIESVLAQSHQNIELIVVDDASSDGSAEVVEDVDDDRVRLVRLQSPRGASAARNVGLGTTRHELVAFQDSDDVWHPRKLEIQLAVLRRGALDGDGVVAVGSTHEPYSTDEWPELPLDVPVLSHDRRSVVAGCRGTGTPKLLINRGRESGLDQTLFDERLRVAEDREFVARLLVGTSKIAVVELPLVRVRRGRPDHAANDQDALAAYLRLEHIFEPDLRNDRVLRDWYTYMTMRAALAAGERSIAASQRQRLSTPRDPRILVEYGLGAVLNARGLSIAKRLGLAADWSHRHERGHDQATADDFG